MLVQSSKVYVVRIGGLLEAVFRDQDTAESYKRELGEGLGAQAEVLEGEETAVLLPEFCVGNSSAVGVAS